MKKFKKSPFERMKEQSVKEGIVYLPVSRDNTERFDIRTYIVCDTHRNDVSIDQDWVEPSGPHDFGDYIPLYLICFGKKQIEISSERTLEEVIDILKNENIEVKSILRIQNLETTRELERQRALSVYLESSADLSNAKASEF